MCFITTQVFKLPPSTNLHERLRSHKNEDEKHLNFFAKLAEARDGGLAVQEEEAEPQAIDTQTGRVQGGHLCLCSSEHQRASGKRRNCVPAMQRRPSRSASLWPHHDGAETGASQGRDAYA